MDDDDSCAQNFCAHIWMVIYGKSMNKLSTETIILFYTTPSPVFTIENLSEGRHSRRRSANLSEEHLCQNRDCMGYATSGSLVAQEMEEEGSVRGGLERRDVER